MKDEKFLQEEILSDEELEKISGGDIGDTSDDSKFLYEYGLVDTWHRELHTIFFWKSDSAAVDAGWAKAGITCVTNPTPLSYNKYFKDGKEISRSDAYKFVKENFKKIRDAYA